MEHNLSDKFLQSRGVAGRSRCMIVQRWTELLNPRTVPSYGTRHLNAHSALREMDDLLDLVHDGIIHHLHLEPVREECVEQLRRDASTIAHFGKHRAQLLRNLDLLRSDKRSSQLRLKYQLSHGLPRMDESYLEWLLGDIYDALLRDDTAASQSILSALATELLSMGWSRRALYESRNLLIEAMGSETGWVDFVNVLTRGTATYDCIFLVDNELREDEESALRKLELSVCGRAELLSRPFYEGRGRDIPAARRYLVTAVEAHDPFAALELAEGRLSSALDTLELFRFGGLSIGDNRIVVCADQNILRRVDGSQHKWMELPTSFMPVAFDAIAQHMRAPALSSVDKSRYATALSYYRMGMQAMESTSRFINLWVALESFCRTPAFEKVIESVVCRIPELLATTHIYRLVRNYYEDCRRTGVIQLKEIVAVGSNVSSRHVVGQTVTALLDPCKQEALGEATDFYSLLRERTLQMVKLLSDPGSAAAAMRSHRKRLYWHIQRLYRIRNSIIHTGTTTTNLSTLTVHLQNYVVRTLTLTAADIASGKATGIDAALERAVDNHEATVDVLKGGQRIDKRLVLDGALG